MSDEEVKDTSEDQEINNDPFPRLHLLPPDLPTDASGFKELTWAQLRDVFSYEGEAKGYKIHGEITQRHNQHWENCKQIHVRDRTGEERAIFFYPADPSPYFSYDDVQIGFMIDIRDPMYHMFMDRQEGMRIEDASKIANIVKKSLTDTTKLDLCRINKDHGTNKYKEKKYDDAIQFYETAIGHGELTLKETPERQAEANELVAQCYLNVAACNFEKKQYDHVLMTCQRALERNANSTLNAKAYFRMGQVALIRKEHNESRRCLEKALEFAPGDARILEELNKLSVEIVSNLDSERKLFKDTSAEKKSLFGVKKSLLSAPPNDLDSVPNFRCVYGYNLQSTGQKIKKHMLYRSGLLTGITKSDITGLTQDLGVKTIIDLRRFNEFSIVERTRERPLKKVFQKQISLKCVPNAGTPSLGGVEIDSIRVWVHLDIASRMVAHFVGMFHRFIAFVLWICCYFIPLRSRTSHHYTTRRLLSLTDVLGSYKVLSQVGGPEIAAVANILRNKANYPVLIHCAQGKDRTGIIIALLLSGVGVADGDVLMDYVKSNEAEGRLEAANRRLGFGSVPFGRCRGDDIFDLLQYLRKKYGSMERYFEAIGVSKEWLAEIRSALCD